MLHCLIELYLKNESSAINEDFQDGDSVKPERAVLCTAQIDCTPLKLALPQSAVG